MVVVFPFNLFFSVKGKTAKLTKLDKEMENFGMRMRLSGRDMMRLGGVVGKFSSGMLANFNKILKESLDWQCGLEDIQDAITDVADIFGETFAPILDIVVDLIESFADTLERFPALKWVFALSAVLLIIGVLVGKLMTLLGTLQLYIGLMIVSSKASLGLGASLKVLVIGLTQGREAAEKYIKSQKKMQKLGKTQKKQSKHTKSLTGRIKAFGKSTKGALKGVLALGSGVLSLGLFAVLSQRLAEPLQDLWESMADALEPIMDPLEGIIYALTDWIEENPELFKNLILFFGLLVPLIWALSKFGVLSKIGGALAGVFGKGVGGIAGPMGKASEGTWKNTLALAAFVAALALLFLVIAKFFTDLMALGVGVWEVVGVLGAVFAILLGFMAGMALTTKLFAKMGSETWKGIAAMAAIVAVISLVILSLTGLMSVLKDTPGGIGALFAVVGAIILLIGTVLVLAAVLTPLAPILAPMVGILIAVGLAINLVGLGFMFAGIGAKFFADAFVLVLNALITSLDKLPKLISVLFSLGAGLLAAGFGGMVAMAGLLAAAFGLGLVTVALLGTAFGIAAVASAIFLLAMALNSIPDWARGMAGGIIGSIGGMLGGIAGVPIPRLAEGGIVSSGGVAVLHPEEEIVPAEVTKKKTGEVPSEVTININAPVGSREIAESMTGEIEKVLDRHIRERGG